MIRPAGPRSASHVLFATIVLGAMVYKLGPTLLAGLLSYTIIDITHRRLSIWTRPLTARWLSLLIFVLTAAFMTTVSGRMLSRSLVAVPAILAKLIPVISGLSIQYGVDLPFDNMNELRQIALETLTDNAGGVTQASRLLTKEFFHVVLGIFVAVLCFMSDSRRIEAPSLYESLRREFNERVRRFMLSFERVFGAQVIISSINTLCTSVFLLVLDFPHVQFLVPATFILGILPVIGNILSNTIIVGAALTISPRHAVLSLIFLVLIHKTEYFLNSRIVGGSIRAPMWQTLLAILIGEVMLGVPGILMAPAIMHYLREELQETPAPR